ncbi:MAG: hypothetical protein ACOYNR_13350 [Blastocatellia bacterium]
MTEIQPEGLTAERWFHVDGRRRWVTLRCDTRTARASPQKGPVPLSHPDTSSTERRALRKWAMMARNVAALPLTRPASRVVPSLKYGN